MKSIAATAWLGNIEEADILYLSFVSPPNAVEHEEDEKDIIRNYDAYGDSTGLTVIAARRFVHNAVAAI